MHFGFSTFLKKGSPAPAPQTFKTAEPADTPNTQIGPQPVRKPVQPERFQAGFPAHFENLPGRNLDEAMCQLIWQYGQRFDPQTRLLNQQAFQAALAAMLQQRQAGREVVLLWIDMLNLRREFALWGPTAAEALAMHVADSLRLAVDGGALLGRFGVQCFLVAMPASKTSRADRRHIQSIVNALEPMRLLSMEIRPEIAAGAAFYPSDAASADELVRFASLAASRSAASRSSAVTIFDAAMNSLLRRDHELEVEIHKGMEQHQFRLHYQPKISLETGEVVGAEALMRWIHPQWGPVPQSEFIPIAERSYLIDRIFEFALRTALWDAQKWRERGLPIPSISVNASPANLRHEEFARHVLDIQQQIPVAPTQLELEVTESMLLEDEELFGNRLRQVRAAGATISIDDFGTRYTSFNLLRSLPLHAMKIDHCFIEGVDRSPEMQALCQTIVAMARQMKLATVAEGIETAGELEVMRVIGCDAGQGYLFQRPIPADEFALFLREWPRRKRSLGFVDRYERAAGL